MWLWIHLLVLLASITVNCSVRYQRKPGFDDGYLAALTVSGSAQRQHTLKTHQTSMDRNPVVLDESTSFPAHSQLHHGAHRQSEVQHGDIRRPLCFSINSFILQELPACSCTCRRNLCTCVLYLQEHGCSGVASLFPCSLFH